MGIGKCPVPESIAALPILWDKEPEAEADDEIGYYRKIGIITDPNPIEEGNATWEAEIMAKKIADPGWGWA